MRIDLHVHSNASDGTDAPAEVIRRASAAALDILALTDHDTQAGIAQACGALPAGLTLVPGMELSCLLDVPDGSQRSVHLLAYLFAPDDPALATETTRIRDDRLYRAQGMVARLNALGAPVTWEQVTRIAGDAVVGRPHIARAMAEAGVVATPADAFTGEWIADGGRAYVDRYAIPVDRAVALIRAAGGVPVLAHPRSPGYEVPDAVIARLAAAGLAGLEVNHPDHDSAQRDLLTGLCTSLGLMVTGGSDDHGSFNNSGLGRETTPPESYERLLSLAHGDAPVPVVPPEAIPPQVPGPEDLPPDVIPPQRLPGSSSVARMDARIELVWTPGVAEDDDSADTVEANSWIVGDDEEVIVIDPGEDAAAVLEAVGDREVIAVICTHGHAAHVVAALEVAERDEAPVALHPADKVSWRSVIDGDDPEIEMAHGGAFEVADVTLEVMHTPGHSPGSVSLYCSELDVVFTGDALLASGPAPHDHEYPDFPRQLNSIGEFLLDLPGETRVLPGHGEEITIAAASKRFDSWVTAGPGESA